MRKRRPQVFLQKASVPGSHPPKRELFYPGIQQVKIRISMKCDLLRLQQMLTAFFKKLQRLQSLLSLPVSSIHRRRQVMKLRRHIRVKLLQLVQLYDSPDSSYRFITPLEIPFIQGHKQCCAAHQIQQILILLCLGK